ncbi:hypothetical protein ES705_12004 [subsurface metagenome]
MTNEKDITNHKSDTRSVPAESRRRQFRGRTGKALRIFTILVAIYLLVYISGVLSYINVFIYPLRHNAFVLMFILVVTYIFYPASRRSPRDRVPWYDIIAILLSIAVNLYIIVDCIEIAKRPYVAPSILEQAFALIIVGLILEGVRRTTSPILTIVGLVFFIYPFVAGSLPAFLFSRSQSLARVTDIMYVFPHGIYSQLLNIFATLIPAFLLFGAFLQVSGAGKFLTMTSYGLMGRYRGGPAKVAELASALFGSINGSGVANVALTGPVTIPLMKKVGYKPHFAAAVEAVASNGGQIVPPIMGLAAFIMMDMLGISYATIMLTAIIPAILYYVALFMMLDFEAAKTGLKGLPRQELPVVSSVLKSGWPYLIPVAFLVIVIAVFRWSPQTACVWGIVIVLASSWLVKGGGMRWGNITDALSKGIESMPQLGVTICMAAILVGSIELTGVGFRMAGGLVTLADGNLLMLLVFTAFAAMILGMGMPTSGVYILVSILLAPALVMAGLQPIVAHFFVFYMGLTAMLTPPVCLCAFVAASIADAPFMKTGWQAMRLGIIVYIVPFMFAFSPALLMIGDAGEIALAVASSIIGVVLLSAGMQGYFLKTASWPERILFLGAGLCMMIPGWTTDIIGLGVGTATVFYQLVTRRAALHTAGGNGGTIE